jgi:hypothetical protein
VVNAGDANQKDHAEESGGVRVPNPRRLSATPRDCVLIGDPESDIYELFCLADELGTNFLLRTCINQLVQDGVPAVESN